MKMRLISLSKAFGVIAVTSLSVEVTQGEFAQPQYPATVLNTMKNARCTNIDQIDAAIGFSNEKRDPYPSYGYDTSISPLHNCYVKWAQPGKFDLYELWTATESEASAANSSGTIHLTHTTPCGSCSTLSNLHTYLTVTDLTSPVKRCGFKFIQRRSIKCLQRLGFDGSCAWIWYWNTRNTRKSRGKGGCLGTCLSNLLTNNIQENEGPMGNPCSPSTCKNTINGEPVCTADQYENGPYRLNPCLQCDECKSGPIFQKIAGRTRRASGIPSAIRRPPGDISELTHYYGIPAPGLSYAAIGGLVAGLVALASVATFGFRKRRALKKEAEVRDGKQATVVSLASPAATASQ